MYARCLGSATWRLWYRCACYSMLTKLACTVLCRLLLRLQDSAASADALHGGIVCLSRVPSASTVEQTGCNFAWTRACAFVFHCVLWLCCRMCMCSVSKARLLVRLGRRLQVAPSLQLCVRFASAHQFVCFVFGINLVWFGCLVCGWFRLVRLRHYVLIDWLAYVFRCDLQRVRFF